MDALRVEAIDEFPVTLALALAAATLALALAVVPLILAVVGVVVLVATLADTCTTLCSPSVISAESRAAPEAHFRR